MKSGSLLLLAAVLIVVVLNLLVSLGVIGGGDSTGEAGEDSWEYKVMSAPEMDEIGYKAVAADAGIKPDEEGKMTLPREKVVIQAIMPRTLDEIQKDGWKLLTTEVTQGGNYFIFRRPKQ
jgi:hypothetical protein